MGKSYRGPEDPLWYKDAVVYQVHVRAFHDSNGDGIGDFRGLAEKLDYLKDLGVDTLWLLPFFPSPLRDDGYDTADYMGIHSMYGTMTDFRHFLREAHARGLRVVTELVLNHTSDQHPWFQRARRAAPDSWWRNFYVWSDTPEKYREARIIFKDFENSNWTWDSVAKSYYWHRFYSHQPDLNFENPYVHRALLQVVDFWFDLGVDGLRLDAVPYLYESEGTSCENLPDTHEFLKKVRAHVDAKHRNRLLLAEANQWPEDAVAYFGEGNECHMAFNFPIMPRLFMAVHMEDRYPIIDMLEQTPPPPETCQWALFLRNHDELTLEMVTDEERDYMYRVYASDPQARINLGIRRRLAPLLQNNRRKIELLNGLLFSLPGTPVIYYGDEIGMGDNIYLGDRNGVRTPMQWSSDRNAGFSRANPQRLFLPVTIDPEYHYEAINVEAQQNNPNALVWWMRRMLALSRRFKAFGRGSMEVLTPENRKVLAFLRRHGDETILVVANLSRFVQYVELDLAEFRGRVPVELFGRTELPPIGELTYLLTLGPHAFYWLSLEPARAPEPDGPSPVASIEVSGEWTQAFRDQAGAVLEEALVPYLEGRRWFAGKARRLKSVKLLDVVPIPVSGVKVAFVGAQADFDQGDHQTYSLILSFASGDRAERILDDSPTAVVCRLKAKGEVGVLHDALHDPSFFGDLLDMIGRRRHLKGRTGLIQTIPTPLYKSLRGAGPVPASVMRGEQSNSSIAFGDKLILKLMRRVEPGVNPDLEVGRFLAERTSFAGSPPVAGYLEYRRDGSEPWTFGVLTGFVANQGDAWEFTLDELRRTLEVLRSRSEPLSHADVPSGPAMSLIEQVPEPEHLELLGSYVEVARRLGERTADLHLALASAPDDPDFAPEPFTPFYQRSVYQSMRNQVGKVFPLLDRRLRDLPDEARKDAERLRSMEAKLMGCLHAVSARKIESMRIRCHGDFHLGQVLYTGKDFVILDFEGEPSRSLSERRIKRSPLRDVAGMIRSFHYAAWSALFDVEASGEVSREGLASLEVGARLWATWAGSVYLRCYLERAGRPPFLPVHRDQTGVLLNAFLLDKAVYELGYELNHRPSWVRIPLKGLLHLLDSIV